jgi:hypothetical protein
MTPAPIGLSEMIAGPAVVGRAGCLATGRAECDCAGPPNYRRRPQCWREVLPDLLYVQAIASGCIKWPWGQQFLVSCRACASCCSF